MSKIIVVTSGKGGVGKTTSSAAIASGLALAGKKTVVVDFDIGLRNIDIIMGCERRVVYDLINVIQKQAKLNQALIKDKRIDNLFILPASQTKDKEYLTKEGVGRVMEELKERFEYIICDSPAGIERGAVMALYHADIALVVTNPEISSIRDSDRMLGVIQSKSKRSEEDLEPVKEYLLVTRYMAAKVKKGDMMSIDDIKDILEIPLIGVVPESETVLKASNSGIPVIFNQSSSAGQAYADTVDRILGKDKDIRFIKEPKKNIIQLIFG